MVDKYLTPEERRKMNTFNRSNGRNKQMRAKEMLGVPERNLVASLQTKNIGIVKFVLKLKAEIK